jgi:hypothetical protein
MLAKDWMRSATLSALTKERINISMNRLKPRIIRIDRPYTVIRVGDITFAVETVSGKKYILPFL